MVQKHNGKIALITGANKGIGCEVARQLGAQGITVLVGARNPQLGEAAAAKLNADGAEAHFIALDVTKPDSITKAAERIRAQYGRLDILVNNAGVVAKGDGPPSVANPDAVREVLEINFFGVLAVTQAMLPLVRNAASGRIVIVSSGLGSLTWNADPSWPFAAIKPLGYNGSKAIVNMMPRLGVSSRPGELFPGKSSSCQRVGPRISRAIRSAQPTNRSRAAACANARKSRSLEISKTLASMQLCAISASPSRAFRFCARTRARSLPARCQ